MMQIEWAYLRKGWTSCTKAQAVFAERDISIAEIVEARKRKIEGDDAWNLLSGAETLVVGRGKKVVVYDPKNDHK